MLTRLKALAINRPFAFLSGLALIVFGIHVITLVDYPPCWFDEIEIIEMGRFSLFDVHPDWSVNLIPSSSAVPQVPQPYFHYLFAAIQESLYRLTGSFVAGRLLALASLPVSALLLCKWLATKGFGTITLLMTTTLFLLDPNATICAHWYRPDLWTLSIALVTMILLSVSRTKAPLPRRFACLVAGALSCTMLFVWITSMLLLPLIAWEAVASVRRLDEEPQQNTIRRGLLDTAMFAVGGLLAAVTWLLPLYPHIPAIIRQYAELSELGGGGDSGGIIQHVTDFVKIALRSPCVWTFAGLGIALAVRKRTIHVLIFLGLCLLMLKTRVYHLRMIQLLPFLFLFAADAIDWAMQHKGKMLSQGANVLLALAVSSYFSLSVLALNFAALPSGNTFSALTKRLEKALATPNPNVYLYDMEHELYYSGRALGWQMYSYANRETIFNASRSANLLDRLDAVVITDFAKRPPTDADLALLKKKGFTNVETIKLPHGRCCRIKELFATLFYAHGYPDCTIYSKGGN